MAGGYFARGKFSFLNLYGLRHFIANRYLFRLLFKFEFLYILIKKYIEVYVPMTIVQDVSFCALIF